MHIQETHTIYEMLRRRTAVMEYMIIMVHLHEDFEIPAD